MEITSRGNSLKQQLAGALAFTEVPLPEIKKRDFISSHDSGQSLNLAEDLLSGASFRIPSRPRSKPSSNPGRRINRDLIPPITPSKNESQVNIDQIPPITPCKNEGQVENSENNDQETNSAQKKQKRKKYKPKVVDDGASGKKTTKSKPGNSQSLTPDFKHTNAKTPTTLDPKHQGPRDPITPEQKLTNHEAQYDTKPVTPEAPVSCEPKLTNQEASVACELEPESRRFPNGDDSKPEKLEGPDTPDPKSGLKPLNSPGLTPSFVSKKRRPPFNKEKSTTAAEQILEKSVRRQLHFGIEDNTELVSSEDIITGTNPNLNKSSNSDDAIEQLKPLQEGLNSDPEAENEPVIQEENTAVTTPSPENSIGITSLDCHNVVKPVPLVADGLNFNLGDKTEAVMHGEMHAGMDSRLNQGETGKVNDMLEEIDRAGLKDYLIHLTTKRLRGRGVKRGRAKQSPKLNFNDMLEEIVLKMTQMKLYENAIIPYQEKRDKYRGIVALDEDSLIEWNRLMGEDNGDSNSAPGLNPEREEKWRTERDNFRNMAEWFIAKMKLIQGNRCFSEWKGSVVDSVVGAFLTQNVSDQLSSSAFISLCARFPRQKDGDVTWPDKKFSDFEGTKSHLIDEPTSVADITDIHIKGTPQKAPKGKTPQEFTKEGSGSLKVKKANVPKKKGHKVGQEDIDWDAIRKKLSCHGHTKEGRSVKVEHSADWDAVRHSDKSEIAKAIHGRGQDNVLAERIQDFLNRVVKDHGSMDLEWLREIPGDQAKEYLLSIYGLGLKSVECIRLLALHQVAFPVDTNVGRICVRLGWVPLQPLPESVQIHLLEMYPVMDSIQKYLWPRLCKLDQETLYELHYQMITFGKVFCTKSKPNCNACPLRSDCKHFASAFASARLMLPGPQEQQGNKVVIWNSSPAAFENARNSFPNPTDVPTAQFAALPRSSNSEPIIEEPMTPEEEQRVDEIPDIEDLCFDDPDEIPTINLNMESFVRNIEELVRENDSELQIEDISKALVLLPPIAASIPLPQLKHSRHLRTVHEAYELPDGHPILSWLEFEERDPDDPSPYLLILYSPEKEVVDFKPCRCNSCKEAKSCNFLSEEEETSYVKCSLMIPCRTAMRGSFPLNGTYFQVNEVFADHCTTRNPVMVPREEIWRLRRRPIYFGSTVSSILKGLPTDEIQYCFWRGFVCVREFDRVTRYPKPLSSWLHIAPSMKKKIESTQ
ncbi:DNA glycosylase/AP lyase ROS1-like [Carex rostrata]